MLKDIMFVYNVHIVPATLVIRIYRAAFVTLDKLVHCPDNNSKQTSLTTACGELDVTS